MIKGSLPKDSGGRCCFLMGNRSACQISQTNATLHVANLFCLDDNVYSQLCLPCLLHFTDEKKGILKMSPNSFSVTQLGSDGGRICTWGNLAFPILLCLLAEAQAWWSFHQLFCPQQKSRAAVCSVCCWARTVYLQPPDSELSLWTWGPTTQGFSSHWNLDSWRDLNGSQGHFGTLIS